MSKPKSNANEPEVSSEDYMIDQHVNRLRAWRNPQRVQPGLGFLEKQVQRELVQPHKKLGKIRDAWLELVPIDIEQRTQLLALQRGVLRIGVSDHATLYELQQILNAGLQSQLSKTSQMNFKQIRLQIMPELSQGIDH